MMFNVIIPIVFICIGIWLKKGAIQNSKGIEKYWWAFIVIGIIRLIFEIIERKLL